MYKFPVVLIQTSYTAFQNCSLYNYRKVHISEISSTRDEILNSSHELFRKDCIVIAATSLRNYFGGFQCKTGYDGENRDLRCRL
jgi:hypothetical protein